MIRVYKNYNDIPRSLLSPKTEKSITKLLENKKYIPLRHLFNAPDVKNKLKQIYHGKCAYCESIIEASYLDHYRPKSIYYWTTFEWSNLLLACPTCNKQKKTKFPITFKKISEPQLDRNEWRANSSTFLSEEPLLINPEIDNPEDHLSFYPDGRMFAKTKKGKTTIEIINLNRESLVIRRMQIINNIIKKISYQLEPALILFNKQKGQTNHIIKLAFEPILNDIIEHTKPKSEYSLFYKNILSNFDQFIIDQFDEPKTKNLLQKVKNVLFDNIEKSTKIYKKRKVDYNLEEKSLLQSIQIKNIKCFKNTEITFDAKNSVLLGVNGRGKTTILQLLALGLSGSERPPFESEWKDVVKDNSIEAGFNIKLKYKNKDIILSYTIIDDKVVNNYQIKNTDKIKKQEPFFVAYGTGRNAEPQNFKLNENFQNIASLFGINNLHFRNGEIFDYLKQGSAFLQIKRIITDIFNKADDIYNRIELSRFDENSRTFLFKTPTRPDIEIPLNALSAGFRTSFQWILDFVVRAWKNNYNLDKPETIQGIVLIDELDTHLHIKWQRAIMNTLQTVFKNVQFIVTTHSPFIVQSFGNQNITSLQLRENEVVAKSINIEEGSSYESIIKDLFGEKATFSVDIEKMFDKFYIYLKEIRNKRKSIEDIDFKKIITDLNKKGEEIRTIISLELRQLKFEIKKKQ